MRVFKGRWKGLMTAFHCRVCGKYHVGHKKKHFASRADMKGYGNAR